MHREGGDPQIVGGDGGALPAELPEEVGIVMGGAVVGKEHANPRFVEESRENLGVLFCLGAAGEAGAKLRRHHEGHPDFSGRLNRLHDGGLTPAEIDITRSGETLVGELWWDLFMGWLP